MKKRYVTIGTLLLVLLFLTVVAGPERIANKLMLYVRIARLYSEEPDRRIAMPLPTVTTKEISDTWHAPRGADRLHEGQDIFAPRGTPIYSATVGYIYNIGENNLGGNTVSVIGAGGRVYYYAHLDAYAPLIAEGDHVNTSTVLGYVGTSGNATGTPPHLHFGVYSPSGAINPLTLLSDRAPASAATNRPAKSPGSQRKNRGRE